MFFDVFCWEKVGRVFHEKIPCTSKILQTYSEKGFGCQNTSSKGVRRIFDALVEVVCYTCVCLFARVV